jgi:hypothetical protein
VPIKTINVYLVERFIPSRCPSCSCHFSSPASFIFWWGGRGQNMTDAMVNQFASFPDLFPPGRHEPDVEEGRDGERGGGSVHVAWSFKNPYDADFIACSSCKNITLRLMYGKVQVLSPDDADALLSRGFTCVTVGEAAGNMARTRSGLCFLGEADFARLNRLITDANSDAVNVDEMSRSDEVAHALDGPLSELLRQDYIEKALHNAAEIIKTYFSSYWSLLDPKTQDRLTQAEHLRQEFTLEFQYGHEPNFAPSVIQYSSALELELQAKVFSPFQRHSKGIFGINPSIGARVSKNYEKLKLFCEGKVKLTLGDMAFIFLHVACSNSDKNSFQEFLDGIGLHRNDLCGRDGIASRINDYTKQYRNVAAHAGHISNEQCAGARAYLIEEPKELLIALARCWASNRNGV